MYSESFNFFTFHQSPITNHQSIQFNRVVVSSLMDNIPFKRRLHASTNKQINFFTLQQSTINNPQSTITNLLLHLFQLTLK